MSHEELLRRHADGGRAAAQDRGAGVSHKPALQTVIVTCMDTRIDAYTLFGLGPGDVHVLRNAGGVITDDVIRSIAISQRRLGTTSVFVMHHTECGMCSVTDDELSNELAADAGYHPPWRPGTFRDPVSDVTEGVRRLRHSPFLYSDTPVRGFVLDIATYEIEEIEVLPTG
jgi:carbonic anhydrase